MKNRIHRISLHVSLCVVLFLAPSFFTQKASAQFVVTDPGATAQRIQAAITEAMNFALEIEKMAEQLLTATGQLTQAKALADQMTQVYQKVSKVVTKGREVMMLYRTIDDTRRNLEAIAQEYQYYAHGGTLSSQRVRRMNYIVRQITSDITDILDYIKNSLFSNDSGMSNAEKKKELETLNRSLQGKNNVARELLEQDKRDMLAFSISQIEQSMIQQMGFGTGVSPIIDPIGPSNGNPFGGHVGGSSGTLLPAIDWDHENGYDADPAEEVITGDNLPADKLFRVVYLLEAVITILMSVIAFYRKNKGEANAQDAILKIVFGALFAAILTTIVQGAFF